MSTKRKRDQPTTRFPLLVQPVEFLSPLPLEECVRRLQAKRTVGWQKSDRLEVYLTRKTPGQYTFIVERIITRKNLRYESREESLRIHGKLTYWDDESTLVSCQPSLFSPLPLTIVLIIAVLVLAYLSFQSLLIALVAAIVAALTMGAASLAYVHEQRRLVHMVDDMLRQPIFR